MWGAILSGVTSLFSSGQDKKAGDATIDASKESQEIAISEAGRQFDLARSDTQLQREVGNQALLALGYMVGVRTPPTAAQIGSMQSELSGLQAQLAEMEGVSAPPEAYKQRSVSDYFTVDNLYLSKQQFKDFQEGSDIGSNFLHPGETMGEAWMGFGGGSASTGSLTIDKQRIQSQISALQQKISTAEMEINMAGQLGGTYVPSQQELDSLGSTLEQAKAKLDEAMAGNDGVKSKRRISPIIPNAQGKTLTGKNAITNAEPEASFAGVTYYRTEMGELVDSDGNYEDDENFQDPPPNARILPENQREAVEAEAFAQQRQKQDEVVAAAESEANIARLQDTVSNLQAQYDTAQETFQTHGAENAGSVIGGVPDLNTLFDDIQMPDVPTLPSISDYLEGLGNDLENSRGYKFEMKQGREVLEGIASKQGTSLGGNQIKAALEYSQNFASTKYAERFQQAIQEYGLESAETIDQYNLDRGAALDKYGMTLDKYNLGVQEEERKAGRLMTLAGYGAAGANTSAGAGGRYSSTVNDATSNYASTVGNVAYNTAASRSDNLNNFANNAMTMYQYNKTMKEYNSSSGAPNSSSNASVYNDYPVA